MCLFVFVYAIQFITICFCIFVCTRWFDIISFFHSLSIYLSSVDVWVCGWVCTTPHSILGVNFIPDIFFLLFSAIYIHQMNPANNYYPYKVLALSRTRTRTRTRISHIPNNTISVAAVSAITYIHSNNNSNTHTHIQTKTFVAAAAVILKKQQYLRELERFNTSTFYEFLSAGFIRWIYIMNSKKMMSALYRNQEIFNSKNVEKI